MTENQDQALRPSFYQEFTTRLEAVDEVKKVDEDQMALAYITHYKGWKLLKDYKLRLEEYLDGLIAEGMAQGMSMSELGERTMVKELTKLVLNSFIRKAEDARKHEQ